jgi:hypothetical protein
MAEEIINEEIVPVETVTYGDPQPKPKNYVKKIHENLVEAFGVNEVPDEVTFTKKIKDPAYAKLIHENLVDAYGASEVPDFKTFSINFSTDPEKKNLGATGGTGSAQSESKLPLQGFSQEQLNLLQKGVEPPKPSGKASIGKLNIPTNLPKQEVAAYERQLKTNEAAINTLTDIYKKKGLIFDPSKPAAQKQIQEYITKERDNDLTRVVGIKDGKQYLVRSEGFWESAGNALKRSITDPIESTNINMTNDANELADLLDEKIKKEPNIPEGAPSRFAGYLGELGGGLPKMMGLLAIPYVGEQAMVGEMYYNALANQRRFLYEKGLADGMDRVTSAENAMKNAPLTAIPDAVVAAAMARGVGGGGSKMITGAAKESFLKAVGGGLKGVAKVSAIGGTAEFGRSKMQQAQGYDITDAEAIENGLRGAGDYAIMDAAFKLAHAGPKYISSAAKNLLSELPKEIVEVAAENYPDGKRTLEELPKFAETKAKVQDFVPEEKVAAVTGLTEKTDNLKADIIALEEKKKGVTSAIAKQIDLEIADKNKEINFYDNQIKKVLESKDPTGITEEVDDITGYKVSEEVKVKPSEAIGEFANRIAKGEKMESPEDLQFYENNKTEIEKALKAKAEETKPVVIMPEENIAPQIVEPSKGAAVIMPEENIAAETIVVGPEQQGKGAAVIMPEANVAPEVAVKPIEVIEKDNNGNFAPKKFTLNRTAPVEEQAPSISIESIKEESFGGEMPTDVKEVKLLEIRGRNAEGETVGSVSIKMNDGTSNVYEVKFNDEKLSTLEIKPTELKEEIKFGEPQVPVSIPEEVYNPIVDKIKKGIQKLSSTAKVSVLKGKNFGKALDEAIKTGAVNLQSWGGFEKKGFEESPQWQKLIDDGSVKLNFDMKGLEGKPVVVINPDNMLTGAVLTKNGKPIIDGNGGINFVTKFGDVWASSDNATANTLARYINEAREKDIAAGGDGTVHVVVTKGDLSKSLTSHTGAKAAMKVLEYIVDKKYVSLSDFRKALTDVGKKYNIDLDGRLDAKAIHDDIAKKFFGVTDSTFAKRGFFVQDVIEHLAKNSKSAKDNIGKIRELLNTEALPQSTERKTGDISFAKEGIIDAIGHLLSDNMTVGVKNSEAYATIEIKHPVEVVNLNKEEGGHESYPFHLRQIDENGNKVKPILNVLGKAQHVTDILNDANNQRVEKKGGAGKFGSNQIGMAKGFVKLAAEQPTGVNMMTDATGKVYGFEQNGKIVLNADLMNGNTPFHEAGHLWLSWAKENRSDLHDAGMSKIEKSKYLQDVVNNKVYQENASKLPESERDAYFKAEALAKAIGDNGERFVNEAQKSDFRKWVKDLWETIATQFGLRDLTAEQISNLTLDEFSKKVVSDIVGEQKGKKSVQAEAPKIEVEEPVKTPQQISISKKALGENYNFSKDFDVRGGEVVATDVLTEVTKRAEKNGVDVPTQRAIEVGLMSKGTPEPTEYNIVTAGSHLLSIDAKIAKAQEGGNLAELESLNEQRNEVLSVLRTLGNKAGRNLGLFNLVFQETDRSQVKLTRDYLKKVLKVSEVPETIAELDKSNLTAEQKKTVRPYVEKIEKAKANFEAIEKEVNKNISKLNDEEINAALEKARAEGKKEGFQEGMKAGTPEEKQKKSKQLKDLASQIRRSDELDKFLKGAGPLGGAEKAGFIDLGSYKEIVANVLDAVATAVELGENVTEAIKKAVEKFKDVDSARLISDVKTIMSKAQLPNKQEVMDKILKISKAENASDITKNISDKGLIKDIVNSYLGENLTNDQVLDAATKDLKKILPNVTREQVADAYAERNQFKKETKAKIENEINQKKADVKRLAIKEARLKALEAANDYLLEETKEGKKRITSEYEKALDEKIKNLLNEKSNVEKQQKVSKTPKTEQDKIDEINKEIKFVKETKSVYEQAIKDPKKSSEALLAAREERDKTYAALGLKLEKSAKAPILVEREYQKALEEIQKSALPDAEKNNKIAELKAQRDLDLQGTKQGVVSSLADDINNFVKSNIENADLNDSLKNILNDLTPSGEKLDDQINKAYNKLNKLAKDENLTKEERQSIETILTDLENNNQLTADELASKRLKKQWENEIRSAETDIASGNFTKLPSTTYDYRRNDELVRLNKARENKSGQLNRMIADAKEKNRTGFEKALDLSTKFLVSGIHTASKVLEAATFKPFMDSMVDLTAGRIATFMTGSPYVSLYSVKKGYKTFAAFKNKEEAQKYILKLQDKRDVALENLKDAYENGGDVKKAEKEFKNADLEYAVSTLYNSIETNVLNSFWQYLKHGATDYDVSIGKSSKKDISEYRTILGKTGYVLDGWIRMHGAMKSSLSARPEMMKVFSSTLKDFQRKGMELSPENISTAMVLAADAYEAGRLTNKTALSKIISRGKGSEKSAAMRYITKGLMPVSTIAVNLAKRGVDYASLGAEGFVRLSNETKKGMRLNEVEGKTYDTLIKAIKDGWNRIPLKERVYINGVIGRGLFGSAIMLATAYGLKNGMVKYGGTFEDQRKRKVMGSDDEQLKAGEWEFFGTRMPKAASLFLNHLPEFLAVSLIADNYQINQMGGTGGEKFETTIDEIEARLPFQTMAGLFVPGRRVNTIVDRFTRIPIAAEAATLLDEKAEFRDKSDFINRIRGNVGFGIVNPTKEQQKQINEIMKQIRKLPAGTLTLEDEKDIDAIIEDIKNTDFGELEMKKAMEESKKE